MQDTYYCVWNAHVYVDLLENRKFLRRNLYKYVLVLCVKVNELIMVLKIMNSCDVRIMSSNFSLIFFLCIFGNLDLFALFEFLFYAEKPAI